MVHHVWVFVLIVLLVAVLGLRGPEKRRKKANDVQKGGPRS